MYDSRDVRKWRLCESRGLPDPWVTRPAKTGVRLQELPVLIKEGSITSDTIVFDDLVSTVGELRDRFRVPLRATWMERYL